MQTENSLQIKQELPSVASPTGKTTGIMACLFQEGSLTGLVENGLSCRAFENLPCLFVNPDLTEVLIENRIYIYI